jgi:alanine racemase
MRILNFLRKYKNILNNSANHLLRIDLNKENLLNNISQYKKKFPEYDLIVVLKSNAYGHGLKEIGSFLDKNENVKCFAVDSIVEAKILKDFGIKKDILILGYVLSSSIKELKKIYNHILMVNSFFQAEFLSENIDFPLKIHLKVDSGMNRQGIVFEDFLKTINILKKNKNIKILGMATHLADADNFENKQPTLKQIEKWKLALDIFKKNISENGMFHFSATKGIPFLKEGESNTLRIGLGIYGFNSSFKDISLKPVLSFWAKIVNIKNLKKGNSIGYNFQYTAEQDKKIAIIPCGYYEGIPLKASNKGFCYFNNKPLKILGRISMNLTAIDISDIENIKIEDEVEVFSTENRLNNIENYAKISETTPYEILSRLSRGIKRKIF